MHLWVAPLSTLLSLKIRVLLIGFRRLESAAADVPGGVAEPIVLLWHGTASGTGYLSDSQINQPKYIESEALLFDTGIGLTIRLSRFKAHSTAFQGHAGRCLHPPSRVVCQLVAYRRTMARTSQENFDRLSASMANMICGGLECGRKRCTVNDIEVMPPTGHGQASCGIRKFMDMRCDDSRPLDLSLISYFAVPPAESVVCQASVYRAAP
ncbi:hypothetical protein FB567DRAFT_602419 [Paraphoma chrysanthemicola]|uniref:Uncharacterized protein n=1 Tax=Paraphoma chrysanthemicola TaxID=798071 RepID=A0A8K0R5S3_9PLEO|nr:hypothetical protein FB567DRAFT_602419 [Paraphoma chrysanthemicola]